MQPKELESGSALQELFAWLDYDGDGRITVEEVKRFVTPQEAAQVVTLRGHGGFIGLEDFTALVRDIVGGLKGPGRRMPGATSAWHPRGGLG